MPSKSKRDTAEIESMGLNAVQVQKIEAIQLKWETTHENLRNVNKRLYGILDSVAEILANPDLTESEKLSRIASTPIINKG